MPYTAPSVSDFRTRFPEFEDAVTYPDDTISARIVLANRQVDESWFEDDYQEAILLLTAHMVAGGSAGAASLGQDDLKSLSIGPLSLSFGDKISFADYSTTGYGQEFVLLRKRNKPALLII